MLSPLFPVGSGAVVTMIGALLGVFWKLMWKGNDQELMQSNSEFYNRNEIEITGNGTNLNTCGETDLFK